MWGCTQLIQLCVNITDGHTHTHTPHRHHCDHDSLSRDLHLSLSDVPRGENQVQEQGLGLASKTMENQVKAGEKKKTQKLLWAWGYRSVGGVAYLECMDFWTWALAA